MIPKLCPICCTGSIELVLRDTLISAENFRLAYPSSTAVAYRCSAGHGFLLVGEDFRWNQPMREGDGYAMMV
jgi:hypothetical protein